jgi:hypothetical protein
MSENQSLNTKDLSSSSSSSSSSVEDIISLSSEETELIDNTSVLPYVPSKRPKEHPSDTSDLSYATRLSPFFTNPREQQIKFGNFLEEDNTLENDDPRDLNDINYSMMSKVLHLGSYNVNNDKIDLYQPLDYYINHDKKNEFKKFFRDIPDEDDSLVEGESPSSFEICSEPDYNTKDYLNKIPKQEENDLYTQNNLYKLNKYLEWEQYRELANN